METSITTLVCLVEMRSWEELTGWQRGTRGLGGMYGAYLGVGEFFFFFLGGRGWVRGGRRGMGWGLGLRLIVDRGVHDGGCVS